MRIKNQIYDLMSNLRNSNLINYSSVEEAVLEYAQSGKWGGNIVEGIDKMIERDTLKK